MKFAVIVAGGSGTRMGKEIPKQFLDVGGSPVLVHTVSSFLRAYTDMQIIVVLPAPHLELGRKILSDRFADVDFRFAEGGRTRFDSVRSGLKLVDEGAIVFVHDAVRCLVSPDLIRRCFDTAWEKGSAIPVVPMKDSVRRVTESGSEVVDRAVLRAVQTPQTFRVDLIRPAFEQGYQEAFTDEATVLEYGGEKVHLIEGEEFNIKITYPSDLLLAEQFLLNQASSAGGELDVLRIVR